MLLSVAVDGWRKPLPDRRAEDYNAAAMKFKDYYAVNGRRA